jgi:hypothetical protein
MKESGSLWAGTQGQPSGLSLQTTDAVISVLRCGSSSRVLQIRSVPVYQTRQKQLFSIRRHPVNFNNVFPTGKRTVTRQPRGQELLQQRHLHNARRTLAQLTLELRLHVFVE